MDEIIVKGIADAAFPNTYICALKDVLQVIKNHIPSISIEDDLALSELRYNSNTDRYGQMEVDVADLAIRHCHCGLTIDGYYEYVDHLKELLT